MSLTYPTADRASARLTVRDRTDLDRATPEGLALRFIDDATVEIDRPAGAAPGALYEITYTARDPKVSGMGLAAIRDVTAFLRREGGPANPLARDGRSGIDRAIGLGISQSGRALRDFLYFGMNEDEAGRIVFEGMMPVIPGARRSFTNARFAQPGRNPGPQFDRLFPVLGSLHLRGDGGPAERAAGRHAAALPADQHLPRGHAGGFRVRVLGLAREPAGDGRARQPPRHARRRAAYLLSGAPHGNPFDAVARPARPAPCR